MDKEKAWDRKESGRWDLEWYANGRHHFEVFNTRHEAIGKRAVIKDSVTLANGDGLTFRPRFDR